MLVYFTSFVSCVSIILFRNEFVLFFFFSGAGRRRISSSSVPLATSLVYFSISYREKGREGEVDRVTYEYK